MTTNANEAAFSKPAFSHPEGGCDTPNNGLTKREYFAAMAMQGLLSHHALNLEKQIEPVYRGGFSTTNDWDDSEELSQDALKIADALISQLNKTPTNEAP